jgi:GNAT superfamily N-acetyltransferase
MARLPSCRSLSLGENAFLLATGTEDASENWAFVPSHSLEKSDVDRALSFFGESDLPFVWPVFPGAGGAYRQALEEGGLLRRGELTAMICEVRQMRRSPRTQTALAFERAKTKEAAAVWAETAWRAFDSPPGAPAPFVEMALGLFAEPGFLLTLARRNAVPVGTFMLTTRGSGVFGGATGVYYFATLPEERGKGVAGAMMDEIPRIAAPGPVVLQATPQGARFYAFQGFDSLFPIPLCSLTQDVF